jgi:hypothetical protein
MNFILLAYLRIIRKNSYFEIFNKTVHISKCVDLEFELCCMELYENIINHHIQENEESTTLAKDLDILMKNQVSGNLRMAVVYRAERKKILYSQKLMIKYLSKVLKESNKLKKASKMIDPSEVNQMFKKLYL